MAALLLLAVFSLPTLTATQLVGVLGESTAARPLEMSLIQSPGVFAKLVGRELTVSYLKDGVYPIIKVTNSDPVRRVVKISLGSVGDKNFPTQLISLQLGTSTYRLYDHSIRPFNPSYDLTLPPASEKTISLSVKSDQSEKSFGTVKLRLEEF